MKLSRVHRVKTGDRGLVTFLLPDYAREHYAEMIRKGQPDDVYDVTIERPRLRRTTGPGSQNHHLNGHIQQIANEIGDNFDSVKLAIKFEARSLNYPGKDVAGHWIPQSEKECNTEECAILIDTTHRIAAFLGVILDETNT